MRFLVSIFLLVATAAPAQSEVLMYQDDTGRWHGVDSVDKVPGKYRGQVDSIVNDEGSFSTEESVNKNTVNTANEPAESDFASDDDISGFRNYHWEDSPEVLRRVKVFTSIIPELSTYEKINENLMICGVKAEIIRYTFYKDKLSTIKIEFSDDKNYNKVRSSLELKYGYQYLTDEYGRDRITWERDEGSIILSRRGILLLSRYVRLEGYVQGSYEPFRIISVGRPPKNSKEKEDVAE